jgi:T-complex protein 1 subunit zeta
VTETLTLFKQHVSYIYIRLCNKRDKIVYQHYTDTTQYNFLNMAAVTQVNENAEVMRSGQALMVNVMAAKGLQEVLKSNLGPRGTLKMLVGGAGQIKLTKDGGALLAEMQIQHPTAIMISRTAVAQDVQTGDGTTTAVLFCGELLKMAERELNEGVHPRVLTDGFEMAKDHALEFLDEFKIKHDDIAKKRSLLIDVARTSLRTKLDRQLADQLCEIVVDAITCIRREDHMGIDLHMVEIMHMRHKNAADSRLIRGILMDHGARHPDMPTYLENCYVLTCNVSMEYEKTEHSSGFFYKNAQERERMVEAERRFTDIKVKQVIELKKQVCTPENGYNFVVFNQKGIDPGSLDMLAKEGIIALRRAKRRNMERLTLACGGKPVNDTCDLTPDDLGWAGKVYEETLGEDKFTFVEDTRNPTSCTIQVMGPNDHTISQMKGAIRDGLRNVKNSFEDLAVVPGGGAYEIACHNKLMKFMQTVSGKARRGVQAFADALLVVPKTLAENSGFDVMDTIIKMQEEYEKSGIPVGLNCDSGECMSPVEEGIWDNYIVKRQGLHLSNVLATQLLLVDEVMRAGPKIK